MLEQVLLNERRFGRQLIRSEDSLRPNSLVLGSRSRRAKVEVNPELGVFRVHHDCVLCVSQLLFSHCLVLNADELTLESDLGRV